MRKAIFHRKSDNAMVDSIAVSGGSGSCNRVVAACAIRLLRLTRTAKSALDVDEQTSCHAFNSLKALCSFSDLRQAVKFSDATGKPTGSSAPVLHVNKFANKL
ncbi:MAG: hypothetical protein E6G83_13400 [Alphaproteobacteria bacterium]|nr:MAG: hypothetical protein E6G83_13400 [Alphaproteobacteria bacterium]